MAGSSLGVDSGYVLVSWLNYTVETTFAFFSADGADHAGALCGAACGLGALGERLGL